MASPAIEIHHDQKLDAPSGTAKALAATIEKECAGKSSPVHKRKSREVSRKSSLSSFDSTHDTVTLTHAAHSRTGFAEGAVDAAEWILGKSGIYNFR